MSSDSQVQQFCGYFQELTVSTYDKINGEQEVLSLQSDNVRSYMLLSCDYADQTLLEALPLCIAYMLDDDYDDAVGQYAFGTYCDTFSRNCGTLKISSEDLFRVCGEWAEQLPQVLNKLLQMRLDEDSDGTIAVAVGTLKGALAYIAWNSRQ